MCIQEIVSKCREYLFDEASQVVKRHFGYLLDYKNLTNLEGEKTQLERQRAKIKEKVKDANTHGEDILDDVWEWLKNGVSKIQELDEFKDENTRKENMRCFNIFSCPNFKCRYQLSKQGEEMKVNVKKLTDEADKFDTVSRPKPPPMETVFPSIEGYQEFNSRDLIFSSIVDALRDSEVKIVGVYGQGGVGKTTIVQKVGEHVKKNELFDEVVVAVVSRPQNVIDIQQRIAGGLFPKLDLGSDQKERAGQLMNRLNNGKKNLIILDNIWDKLENLNEIGIPITDGNKGCKLVLTSRDRDNWKNMEVHCRDFQIDLLSESEAWDLFKKTVGNSVGDELCPVAQKVCQECRRLPVAITAVGAALKYRDLDAWKNALKKLENSMLNNIVGIDPNLYTNLKLSYDLLQSKDAKSIFLLCCLFPEDADISIDDDLTWHCVARRLLDQEELETLEDARVAVRTVVGILKTSCLLLEGSDKRFVKMHDVIRDVAVSICKLELDKPILVKNGVQEWPEKGGMCKDYSAILLQDTLINELPDEVVCPQLHTLQLEHSFDQLLTVPDNFFNAMEKLNILHLSGICMPSSSSLAKLVNLRMLSLILCELTDASILRDLKKSLEILILAGWNVNHLLPEVGQLIGIRLLDLRDFGSNLKVIPGGVISKLTRLEELYLPDSCDQWERSNASLVELSSLTRLTCLCIHIPYVATLPKDFRGFQKLIRFRISIGKTINQFEDNHEISKASTRILKLSGITLKDNQFSDLLDRAEVLYLEDLHGLMKLIHNRGGVRFLKVKYLKVENCDDLVYLFSSSWAIGTPQLQHLEIKYCQIIENIVGIEEGKDEEELTNKVVNFSHLKYMELERLPNLISFYPRIKKIEGNSSSRLHPLFNEKVTFPALEELVIWNLPNIREIWDEKLTPEIAAESCPKLTVMEVVQCEKCVHVVPSTMLSVLQKIRKLRVVECPMMEVIISDKAIEKKPVCNDVIVFHQLSYLSLWSLPNLKSFCNSITTSEAPLAIFNHRVTFPALKELNIFCLPNIREIWDEKLPPEIAAESCPKLTFMEVNQCEKCVHVVPSTMLSLLQKIIKLTVEDCPMMEVIISDKAIGKKPVSNDVIVFHQLSDLSLQNLPNLKSFCNSNTTSEALLAIFNHRVAFPALEKLHISNLQNFIMIWDEQLLPIAEKEAASCSYPMLTVMEVYDCFKLKHVVSSDLLQGLQKMEELRIRDCGMMEVIVSVKAIENEPFPGDIIVFPQLRALSLEKLPSLKNFCDSISKSEASPALFNYQVAFPKLTELTLVDCFNFGERHLSPHLFGRLRKLEKLIVSNCDWVNEQLNVGEGKHDGLLEAIVLDNLPQLTGLWNRDPHGMQGLRNLKYLIIWNCPILKYLFTSSVAMALKRLEVLCLGSCVMMEEVIVATHEEEEEEEEGDKALVIDEIVFPKLKYLYLLDMPNLKSFCSANCNFNLQSLTKMFINRCPKLQTFTHGVIRMPPRITINEIKGIKVDDFNYYLQQQLLEGEFNGTQIYSKNDLRFQEPFGWIGTLAWFIS